MTSRLLRVSILATAIGLTIAGTARADTIHQGAFSVPPAEARRLFVNLTNDKVRSFLTLCVTGGDQAAVTASIGDGASKPVISAGNCMSVFIVLAPNQTISVSNSGPGPASGTYQLSKLDDDS